ncbi:hypothetical protein [Hyphobacterium sp.]
MIENDKPKPRFARLAAAALWLGLKLYLLYLFASPDGAVPVYQGF